MAGMCGYDFVVLDGEHGLFSESDYLQAHQALAGTDAFAMVRVPGHEPQAIGRHLDIGADAIIVPNVTTPEEANSLVRAMQYPPLGTRGFGAAAHRVTRYGSDLAGHLKDPRGDACLIVMIESASGVANADEIVAIEGVDGVLIGPSDLTAGLGDLGDFANPEYAAALARIERAASERGKFMGTAPHPGYPIDVLIARGYRLLIAGSDVSLIREAMGEQLARARANS
jgi:2-keto-3-deoxy-L-rhamnonate aldolase RhmA